MTLEQRVSANETAINQLMSVQESTLELLREVKQVQVNQQEQINLLLRQMGQFQEHMESMDRFNRQTRNLWVKIARKVDWLDEDDLPEDEV